MAEQKKELRPIIIKMAQHIGISGKDYGFKDPEYYLFHDIVTDEQATVVLALKRRKQEKVEDVAARVNKTYAETFRILMQLADIGILEIKNQGDGTDKFMLGIYIPGILELMILNREQCLKHPEVARAFEEYTRVTVEAVTQFMPMGNGAMRVIPVESAIKSETRKAPYEEISYWLDKYQNHICLAPCQCRLVRKQMGEGTGNMPEDLCLILGATGESCIATGKGRRATREEAEEVIALAEKRGYMHQVSNMDGKTEIWAICNCERNVCLALRTSIYFNTPNMSRSNYIAEVDPEKCVACGACVETCSANAIKLGQNLKVKNPIEYKDSVLCDNHTWTPERYNPDYRENFENTYDTGTAPCKVACPAHIAVQGYIQKAHEGKYLEALEIIKRENPFPAICGRVCAKFCEDECSRGDLDEAVAVDDIKRFIADQEINEKTRFVPEKLFNYSDKKIAIIGAGPAGLSCAYYMSIKGYSITVFEKNEKLGGMLQYGIPSFRLEKDVIDAEIDVIKQLGVEFKTGVEVGKDVTIAELRKQGYEGFLVAVGAQGGRSLNIENADHKDVMSGVEYLRTVAEDNTVKYDGDVVVIGGGNVAIDVARTALRTKSDSKYKVSLVCLEDAKSMPAATEEVEEAVEEGIEVMNSYGPNRVIVENGKVVGVEFKKCTQLKDADGRFNPKYDEKDLKVIKCSNVLLSIGQSIDWGTMFEGEEVEINRNGTAKADELTLQTATEDIFVAGDAYTGPRFAIDAIAAGKEAADSLHRFVQEGQTLNLGRNRRIFTALDKENVDYDSYKNEKAPRVKVARDPKKELTFLDPRITITEDQVLTESNRCLGCGAAYVDANMCFGCGECTVQCKFDAVTLHRKYDAYSYTYEGIKPHAAVRAIKNKVRTKLNPNRDSLTD